MASPAIASAPLRGRRLAVARVVWIALVALILALVVIGVPARYHQLLTLSSENNRALLQLNPEDERALRQLGPSLGFYAAYFTILESIFTLVFAAIGVVIFWRRSDDLWVMFVSFTLVIIGATLTPFLDALAAAHRAWSLPITYVQLLGAGCFLIFLYLFPDGQFVPRWTRGLAVVWTLWLLISPLLFDLSPSGPAINLFDVAGLGWFATGVLAQLYRYHRVSNSLQRQQSKWVVFGLAVTLLAYLTGGLLYVLVPGRGQPGLPNVLFNFILAPVFVFSLLGVPFSISFAILRYRLWDIDRLLNRTLVYGTLSTVIILMYVLVVGGLGALLQTSNTFASFLLTTVVVIALFHPVRARLQEGVDRLTASRGAAAKQARFKHDAAGGHDAAVPRDDRPGAPIRLSRRDYIFRALAIVGVLEIGALAVNLVMLPAGPGIAGQGLFPRAVLGLLVMPIMLMAGALIAWRAPGNVVGRFLILMALGGMAAQFNFTPVGPVLAALLIHLLTLYGGGVVAPSFGYLMLTFPNGQVYPPRLTRVMIVIAVVKFIGVGLEIMASPGKIRIFTPTVNPLFVPALAPYQPIIAATIGIAGVLLPAIWLVGLLSLISRYRASPARERRQMKWVLWALAILMLALLFMASGILTGYVVAGWAFPLATWFGAIGLALFLAATALAVVRYRLFDIDIILNRALVYGALTAGVVGAYALIVGLAGEISHQMGSLMLSLLATGLIAVLFQPVRERLQRAVNRLMYGERDDPYAVLSRLGQQLEATLAPEAVLPTLVETIAQTLKLPYVAIALQRAGGNESDIVATYGLPTGATVHLPLTYQAEPVGELRIAPRAPDETFTSAEQRLLTDIAHQAGVAAHAVRLTADLQRSRERLVAAREEERRRLRRDLHDGLGPKLAGQSLKLEAARDSLDTEPEVSRALLNELIRESQTVVAEIRRLVYALRPPALDELGLLAAVREQAAQCELSGLRVTVTTPPDGLPPLPAAIEVAAYRIVQEALTNVVRHAHARTGCVRLALDPSALWVEVTDDGLGLPRQPQAGVGLHSMRERAEEIGGGCLIQAGPNGGTRVMANLPLPKA